MSLLLLLVRIAYDINFSVSYSTSLPNHHPTDYVSTFPSNNKHNQPTIVVSILSGLASGNNNNNFFTHHHNNNNNILICVRV